MNLIMLYVNYSIFLFVKLNWLPKDHVKFHIEIIIISRRIGELKNCAKNIQALLQFTLKIAQFSDSCLSLVLKMISSSCAAKGRKNVRYPVTKEHLLL